VLENGWLGMFGYGVGPFSSVRVLSRSCNDRRRSSSRSSVRVIKGSIDNRVNLACCRLSCRVVGRFLLAVGGGRFVGVVGVVGGFDRLDGVVGHVVCLRRGLDDGMFCG
jgi:hypothetical protein